MMTRKQAEREARRLFRLSLVNGSLDEDRARLIVRRLIDAKSPTALSVVARFERFVRLDRTEHSAVVASAAPLPPDIRAEIEAGVAGLYGRDIVTSFKEDPTLVGGVRISVGSTVYDGSVKARLAALAARF
jgi:F-type H+-transporting ATPase subunit delta